MKKQRQPELHFYEWSISRWLGSGTRMILPDYGRGIYRELLDLCYSQGSIPNINRDPDAKAALAAHCGSTLERFEETWSKVSSKFIRHKKDDTKLISSAAEIIRREYFSYVEGQRARGKRNRGRKTPAESSDKEASAKNVQSHCLESSEPIQTNGKLTAIQTNGNTTATQPLPTGAERFDPEVAFGELWETYPPKGRVKLPDSQRFYVEALMPDPNPERTHARIVEAISPGGKWAESDSWAKGFIPALPEWLRNRRWLEDPPQRGTTSPAANGTASNSRSSRASAILDEMVRQR